MSAHPPASAPPSVVPLDICVLEFWHRFMTDSESHDVIIETADGPIGSHAAILSLASNVLKSQLQPVNGHPMVRIDATDVPKAAVSLLLQFIYCGAVKGKILAATSCAAFDLAIKWQLSHLMPMLKLMLVSRMQGSNLAALGHNLSAEVMAVLEEATEGNSGSGNGGSGNGSSGNGQQGFSHGGRSDGASNPSSDASGAGGVSGGSRVGGGHNQGRPQQPSLRFRLGQVVEAKWQASKLGAAATEWYPGQIIATHDDGTYDIRYDDGDAECRIRSHFIRRRGALAIAPSRRAPLSTSAGGEGEATYRSVGAERGPMTAAHPPTTAAQPPAERPRSSGRTPVPPREWGKTQGAPPRDVPSRDAPRTLSTLMVPDSPASAGGTSVAGDGQGFPPPSSSAVAASASFEVGSRVSARYARGRTWYDGRVHAVNPLDGTYTIAYEDGDFESQVDAACIRPIGQGPSPRHGAREGRTGPDRHTMLEPDHGDLSIGQVVLAYGASPTGETRLFQVPCPVVSLFADAWPWPALTVPGPRLISSHLISSHLISSHLVTPPVALCPGRRVSLLRRAAACARQVRRDGGRQSARSPPACPTDGARASLADRAPTQQRDAGGQPTIHQRGSCGHGATSHRRCHRQRQSPPGAACGRIPLHPLAYTAGPQVTSQQAGWR